jgi:hypothetical protein
LEGCVILMLMLPGGHRGREEVHLGHGAGNHHGVVRQGLRVLLEEHRAGSRLRGTTAEAGGALRL